MTKLQKQQNKNELWAPVGLAKTEIADLWIYMEFGFDKKKTEVVVKRWEITDIYEAPISLSKLTYDQLQFVAAALAEEFDFHAKHYYNDLEAQAYEMRYSSGDHYE